MAPTASKKLHLKELTTAGSLAILGAWGLLMQVSYSRQRAKESKEADVAEAMDRSKILRPENRKSWKDHPLTSWIVENGCVWLQVLVRLSLFAPPGWGTGSNSSLRNVLSVAAAGLWSDRWSMAVQWYVVRHFYSHIPYFKGSAPEIRPLKSLVLECGWVIGLSQVLIALSGRGPGTATGKRWSLARDLRSIGILSLSAKLAIVRTVVDTLFYVGHRIIHHPSIYPTVHKLHHEDVWVNPTTNQHFTIADIFIEAYIPALVGLLTLRGLGIRASTLEQNVLVGYIGWLESHSHAGKPSSATTLVAPIAPLYHCVLGDIDRRNVEFHQPVIC